MKRIVVGIDGSDGARTALKWALTEARLHGADLEVVVAYEIPLTNSIPGAMTPMIPSDVYVKYANGMLDMAVATVVDPNDKTVKVSKSAHHGHPGHVLRESAKDADLLVVGSRGMGGFLGLHVGSVSRYCVHHAPCPVAVIPPSTAVADSV